MPAMDEQLIAKAVPALLKFASSKELSEKFELIITREIPKKRITKPQAIPIRNPTEKSILIFHKDGIDIKELCTSLKIKSMSIKKLKRQKTYEEKRQLCDEFDLFICDERIVEILPKLIGKSFFLKKKHPYVVDVKKLASEVGNTEMSADQIIENVVDAIKYFDLESVRFLYLKTASSTSLPIFHNE